MGCIPNEFTSEVHTFIIEAIDSVYGRAFVISPKYEEVLGILDLE